MYSFGFNSLRKHSQKLARCNVQQATEHSKLQSLKKAAKYEDEAAKYEDEAAKYEDEAAKYEDEAAKYEDEAAKYR